MATFVRLPMLPIYISYFAGGGERTTARTVKNALGGVRGLVISVGIILLAVLLDNKIHTEDDIAKYLALAVVGVIPEYQGGKKK